MENGPVCVKRLPFWLEWLYFLWFLHLPRKNVTELASAIYSFSWCKCVCVCVTVCQSVCMHSFLRGACAHTTPRNPALLPKCIQKEIVWHLCLGPKCWEQATQEVGRAPAHHNWLNGHGSPFILHLGYILNLLGYTFPLSISWSSSFILGSIIMVVANHNCLCARISRRCFL